MENLNNQEKESLVDTEIITEDTYFGDKNNLVEGIDKEEAES